jgi:hypothetical protein
MAVTSWTKECSVIDDITFILLFMSYSDVNWPCNIMKLAIEEEYKDFLLVYSKSRSSNTYTQSLEHPIDRVYI